MKPKGKRAMPEACPRIDACDGAAGSAGGRLPDLPTLTFRLHFDPLDPDNLFSSAWGQHGTRPWMLNPGEEPWMVSRTQVRSEEYSAGS